MTTFFRIQQQDDAAERILDPAQQISHNWADEEDVRRGVSACESIEELAGYLAQVGIPFGTGDWNLIEYTGDYAAEDDHDAELGAVLTIPTAIVEVRDLADVAEFWTAVDAAFDAAA